MILNLIISISIYHWLNLRLDPMLLVILIVVYNIFIFYITRVQYKKGEVFPIYYPFYFISFFLLMFAFDYDFGIIFCIVFILNNLIYYISQGYLWK